MINVATDCREDLSPADFSGMSRWCLEKFASQGTARQRELLIDWAYGNLPHWFFEDLYFMATGEEWRQD